MLTRQLMHTIRSENVFFALAKICRYGVCVLKSAVAARSLGLRRLFLGPNCVVLGSKHILVGENFNAYANMWMEAISQHKSNVFQPKIVIGANVSFSDGVHVSCIDRVEIGNDVLIGSRVYIADHSHGCYSGQDQTNPEIPPAMRQLGGGGRVTIGANVWICDNSIIVGPVDIGKGAIIAANSVVRQSVPAETMVAGAPARPIKVFDKSLGIWKSVPH